MFLKGSLGLSFSQKKFEVSYFGIILSFLHVCVVETKARCGIRDCHMQSQILVDFKTGVLGNPSEKLHERAEHLVAHLFRRK